MLRKTLALLVVLAVAFAALPAGAETDREEAQAWCLAPGFYTPPSVSLADRLAQVEADTSFTIGSGETAEEFALRQRYEAERLWRADSDVQWEAAVNAADGCVPSWLSENPTVSLSVRGTSEATSPPPSAEPTGVACRSRRGATWTGEAMPKWMERQSWQGWSCEALR